ncbi:MAG: peptidoglycan-binding protein [Myxococcales bacterium]|nr:peptidoglycan-binding protein [Myxococcales bacterium]
MRVHVVGVQEDLQRIAWHYGVDAEAIWQLAENDALTKERKPNVLFPGDRVMIPEVAPRRFSLRPGGNNLFVAEVPSTRVTMRFGNPEPLAGVPFVVTGLPGPTQEGVTDGGGRIEVEVPLNAGRFEVAFPSASRRYVIAPGRLDPATTVNGLRARLQHLGYLGLEGDAERASLARAVEAFQARHQLSVTGQADNTTVKKIIEEYGS